MTRATLATRTAAGLSAALISAMSLVACGGDDGSGADEPVEETTEQTDAAADDAADVVDESSERRDRERSATRNQRRGEPSEPSEEPASETSAGGSDSELLTAQEFCVLYTRYETKGVFAGADTPEGAQRAADRLDQLADRAPGAIVDDIELMARLFAEIAEANGDEDKLAEIDASDLPETQKHLERWQRKHC